MEGTGMRQGRTTPEANGELQWPRAASYPRGAGADGGQGEGTEETMSQEAPAVGSQVAEVAVCRLHC